jgi:hypothetical protein
VNNLAKTGIFGMFLLVASLGLGEAAMRAAQYFISGLSPVTMLPEYRERRYRLSPFLVFGPRLDWQILNKPNPDSAYFNTQGFRTRELVGPKAPGEFRIITLGGSTTEDVWTEDGLHWPLWLERQLGAAGLTARVYNAGMSAYTSAHSLVRLEFDILDYQPDLVIVMHNINDLVVNYYAAVAGQPVDGHYRAPYTSKRFTGDVDDSNVVLSRLAHSLRARLRGTPPDLEVPADYAIDRGLGHFRRNLRNMHAIATASGSAIVFLTMPVCEAEDAYRQVVRDGRKRFSAPLPESFERFKREFASYNQAIADVSTAAGASFVDMHGLLGGAEEWFSDFVHYNGAGSKRFGELLGLELAPHIRRMNDDNRPEG